MLSQGNIVLRSTTTYDAEPTHDAELTLREEAEVTPSEATVQNSSSKTSQCQRYTIGRKIMPPEEVVVPCAETRSKSLSKALLFRHGRSGEDRQKRLSTSAPSATQLEANDPVASQRRGVLRRPFLPGETSKRKHQGKTANRILSKSFERLKSLQDAMSPRESKGTKEVRRTENLGIFTRRKEKILQDRELDTTSSGTLSSDASWAYKFDVFEAELSEYSDAEFSILETIIRSNVQKTTKAIEDNAAIDTMLKSVMKKSERIGSVAKKTRKSHEEQGQEVSVTDFDHFTRPRVSLQGEDIPDEIFPSTSVRGPNDNFTDVPEGIFKTESGMKECRYRKWNPVRALLNKNLYDLSESKYRRDEAKNSENECALTELTEWIPRTPIGGESSVTHKAVLVVSHDTDERKNDKIALLDPSSLSENIDASHYASSDTMLPQHTRSKCENTIMTSAIRQAKLSHSDSVKGTPTRVIPNQAFVERSGSDLEQSLAYPPAVIRGQSGFSVDTSQNSMCDASEIEGTFIRGGYDGFSSSHTCSDQDIESAMKHTQMGVLRCGERVSSGAASALYATEEEDCETGKCSSAYVIAEGTLPVLGELVVAALKEMEMMLSCCINDVQQKEHPREVIVHTGNCSPDRDGFVPLVFSFSSASSLDFVKRREDTRHLESDSCRKEILSAGSELNGRGTGTEVHVREDDTTPHSSHEVASSPLAETADNLDPVFCATPVIHCDTSISKDNAEFLFESSDEDHAPDDSVKPMVDVKEGTFGGVVKRIILREEQNQDKEGRNAEKESDTPAPSTNLPS